MSSGIYRRQYEALRSLIVANIAPDAETPDGSFNEKFCAMCRIGIEAIGSEFVGVQGTFHTRKSAYLWQLAVALGTTPDLVFDISTTKAARAIYELENDGETIGAGSLEWRTYLFLLHATAEFLPLQGDLRAWYHTTDEGRLSDKLPIVTPEPDVVGASSATYEGSNFTSIPFSLKAFNINEYVVVIDAKASDTSGIEFLYSGVSGSGGSGNERFYARFFDAGIQVGIGNKSVTFPIADVSIEHEYAIQYNGSGVGRLYVDGVIESTSIAVSSTDYTLDTCLRLGTNGWSIGANNLTGSLADFRLYRTDDYATISEDNLLLHLPLAEGGGNTAWCISDNLDSKLTPVKSRVNGIWTSWIFPRASEHNGYVYYGFIGFDGYQYVARYNTTTHAVESKAILHKFDNDDHNGVSITVDDELGIALFATGHNDTSPENISKTYYGVFADWDAVTTLTNELDWGIDGSDTPAVSYSQVTHLGSRYYIFARCEDTTAGLTRWNMMFSDDSMATWSTAQRVTDEAVDVRYYQHSQHYSTINKTSVVTYGRGQSEDNVIRFGLIDGGYTPHRMYRSSVLYEEMDENITTISRTDFDTVATAGVGEFFRLCDVTYFDGDYYILYIIHDNLNPGTASFRVAHGGFGSWTITNLGVDAGGIVGGLTSVYALGAFAIFGNELHLTLNALSGIYSGSVDQYKLDGTWTYVKSQVFSDCSQRIRPVYPTGSTRDTMLWCDAEVYTSFVDYNSHVAILPDIAPERLTCDATHHNEIATELFSNPKPINATGFDSYGGARIPRYGTVACDGPVLSNGPDQVHNGHEGYLIQAPTATQLFDTIVVSGTGTVADGATDFVTTVNDKPAYVNPISDASVAFPAGNWLMDEPLSSEIWTHPTATGQYPPKTGWSIGSLGSPAPTIAYGSPWINDDGTLRERTLTTALARKNLEDDAADKFGKYLGNCFWKEATQYNQNTIDEMSEAQLKQLERWTGDPTCGFGHLVPALLTDETPALLTDGTPALITKIH